MATSRARNRSTRGTPQRERRRADRRKEGGLSDTFARFARSASEVTGSPGVFILAFAIVLVWAVAGPVFGFSSTWQLVINTGTTIVTFLMVFLIQNAQNRDSAALHLKLDALIDSFPQVREDMVDIEEASTAEIETAREEYRRRRESVDQNGQGRLT